MTDDGPDIINNRGEDAEEEALRLDWNARKYIQLSFALFWPFSWRVWIDDTGFGAELGFLAIVVTAYFGPERDYFGADE